jgi:hypothetical protein
MKSETLLRIKHEHVLNFCLKTFASSSPAADAEGNRPVPCRTCPSVRGTSGSHSGGNNEFILQGYHAAESAEVNRECRRRSRK